nr:hypothetical protein [Tanacetum cinerariifolium]
SSSLYATRPIRSRILNGPMYRGLSFPHFTNRKENSTNESGCEMTITIRDDGDCSSSGNEMCRFGKAIDNDPDGISLGLVFLLRLSVLAMVAACASNAARFSAIMGYREKMWRMS